MLSRAPEQVEQDQGTDAYDPNDPEQVVSFWRSATVVPAGGVALPPYKPSCRSDADPASVVQASDLPRSRSTSGFRRTSCRPSGRPVLGGRRGWMAPCATG